MEGYCLLHMELYLILLVACRICVYTFPSPCWSSVVTCVCGKQRIQ